MMRGKFITFEGGDGVGKSTQIARLADRLQARGVDCVITREPGGTAFAERVREFILGGGLGDGLPAHSALAEALLFSAARVDHVNSLIKPALMAGQWVLCDRFADSTRAYQGAAGGVDSETLMQLEKLTHPDCPPDLTLMLDLEPAAGKQRIAARGTDEAGTDPFEGRDLTFQQRLRSAFLDIAAGDATRCHVVDAAQAPDDVEQAVWSIVTARFELEGV